jgi:sec-independent protein translocase protein TatC
MDRELTFVGHLTELRKRIIISLVALAAGSLICLPFAPQLLRILKLPAAGAIDKLVFFSPQDAFLIYMRIGMTFGLAIAFPVIAYQFWAFISPAIGERFKKNTAYFVSSCVSAFLVGGLFAYFVLLPKALVFLMGFGSSDLAPVISATSYISFVTCIILANGLVFQMPVLSLILTKLGLVNAGMLRRKFPYAIIVIAIVAAVITPTVDAFNMLILAIPMIVLYEVSIWISALSRPSRLQAGGPGEHDPYGRAG